MSLETTSAPEQPAQVAQISSEKKTGAANTSISDFARKLVAAQTAPVVAVKAEAEAKAEPVTEAQEAPKPEETTTAAAETVQTETDEATEETSEVLSPETHALDPKLQEKINRRIGKEVSKTKKEIAARVAAETRIAQLEAQLAERPETPEKEVHVPIPANMPLAEYTSLESLSQYKESLQNDIIEAEGLLFSDFPPEGMKTKWGVVTKPQLIGMLTEAKKTERNAIPAREKFLNARTQATQTANEKFSFLKDPAHPGYQMAKQALKDNPILRTYPNAEYLVGMIVKGQLAMQAEEAAKPEAKAAPAKPKQKPTNGQSEIASDASITRAPTGLMNQNALQAERTAATGGKKSLGPKDFAKLLVANQKFRNS